MQFEQLSVDELLAIISFVEYPLNLFGTILPVLNTELYARIGASYSHECDQAWTMFISMHYPFYLDHTLNIVQEERTMGVKQAFKTIAGRLWNESQKFYQYTKTSGGLYQNLGSYGHSSSYSLNNPQIMGDTISIECWVRPEVAKGELYPGLVMMTTEQNWDCGFGLYGWKLNEDSCNYYFFVNDWGTNYITFGPMEDKKWTHIACTYDGRMMKMYKNGDLVADKVMDQYESIKYISNTVAESSLMIGTSASAGEVYNFEGCLAEIRIWNECRSIEQIRLFKDRRLLGKEPGLIFYAPLNPTDSMFTDITGNNLHLTLYNSNVQINICDAANWSRPDKGRETTIRLHRQHSMKHISPPHEKRVYLEVGGRQFSTSRDTLLSIPNTIFANMLQNYRPDVNQDRIIIDRDGKLFSYILDFFRDGHIHLPSNPRKREQLLQEASYYGLDSSMLTKYQSIPITLPQSTVTIDNTVPQQSEI